MAWIGTDPTLVRIVYSEKWTTTDEQTYQIQAILSRFGDLSVVVWDDTFATIWQGTNILQARDWLMHRTGDVTKAVTI